MSTKIIRVLACAAVVGGFIETALSAESENSYGRFHFGAGYAWRSNVKTDFSGVDGASARNYGSKYGAYDDNAMWKSDDNWSGGKIGTGRFTDPTTDPELPMYHVAMERSDSLGSGSDEEGMHGLNISAGYDFFDVGDFTFGCNLCFASYLGLGNSRPGGYARYRDYFGFSFPYPDLGIEPVSGDDYTDVEQFYDREYLAGARVQTMKYKADLYQVGLGPKVTWHVLDCLDLYAEVDALFNFIDQELDAGAASTDECDFRIGVGGNVGFTGWVTENFGFYGQVGYEWIDDADIETHGCKADTDFSSLVISAGIQFRF